MSPDPSVLETYLMKHLRSNLCNVSTVVLRLAIPVMLVLAMSNSARATFSIVVVDTVTGDVGSAGASCIAGADIIERVVEGIGSINTQSFWNGQNQNRAESLMIAGDTPDSIIAYMVANDSQSDGLDQDDRQYGMVTIAGPGASQAHTGSSNSFWAGHRTGPGYSIQGNILLDSTIVFMMEDAWLSTPGSMEFRLMAVLQAAKVPGADIRCFNNSKSSISAFVKVVHPGDGTEPWIDEVVGNTVPSVDPIDILQDQFDAWFAAQAGDADLSTMSIDRGAMASTGNDTATITISPLNLNGLPPTKGALVTLTNSGTGTLLPAIDNGDGTFSALLIAGTTEETETIRAFVDAGGAVVELTQVLEVIYFLCGDVNITGSVTSSDIIYMVNHVFKSGPSPQPAAAAGDVDRSGTITSADIIAMVNFVFKSGPALCN